MYIHTGTREEERLTAIQIILERNPDAFKPMVKDHGSDPTGMYIHIQVYMYIIAHV
jgi:hypothetical protein